MTTETILQAAANAVLGRYRPEGNFHHPEWDKKYLGVSSLVKKSATEYAVKVTDQKNGTYVDEMVDKYWSYKGNTLADGALVDCDAWEVRGEVPLGPTGWTLAGHIDGVRTIDLAIAGFEHKSHASCSKKNVEAAKRQCLLDLALMDAEHDAGRTVFPVADFMTDEHKPREWTWPEGAVIGGALACIAPNDPRDYDPEVFITPCTKQDLHEVLEFYKGKALAIINAVENDNLSYAQDWDKQHGEEFYRPIEQMNEAIPEMPDLALQYKRATIAEKDAKEAKDEAKGLIMAIMDKTDQSKGQWNDGLIKVSMVETKERVQPAYTVSGSRYPRVTVSKALLEAE